MLPFLPVEQAKNLGINFDSYPTLSIQSIKSCQFYLLVSFSIATLTGQFNLTPPSSVAFF